MKECPPSYQPTHLWDKDGGAKISPCQKWSSPVHGCLCSLCSQNKFVLFPCLTYLPKRWWLLAASKGAVKGEAWSGFLTAQHFSKRKQQRSPSAIASLVSINTKLSHPQSLLDVVGPYFKAFSEQITHLLSTHNHTTSPLKILCWGRNLSFLSIEKGWKVMNNTSL